MLKKSLILAILGAFLLTGFGFGQVVQKDKEQGQPQLAPYLQIYGGDWQVLWQETVGTFDDIEVVKGYIGDANGIGGIVKLLIIKKGDNVMTIAGWMHSYTGGEQGFVVIGDRWYISKTFAEGELLREVYTIDANNNPVIQFYSLRDLDREPPTQELVVEIDVLKFVEENFGKNF